MPVVTQGDGGIYLDVHVQAGARRPGIVGLYGDRLKVAVAEPAAEGRANRAVVAAVAGLLGVETGRVSLVSGAASRSKRLFVLGVSRGQAESQVRRAAG